jgi:hypothetical protein
VSRAGVWEKVPEASQLDALERLLDAYGLSGLQRVTARLVEGGSSLRFLFADSLRFPLRGASSVLLGRLLEGGTVGGCCCVPPPYLCCTEGGSSLQFVCSCLVSFLVCFCFFVVVAVLRPGA